MTKHFFIVNPAAGKGVEFSPLIEKIHDACRVSHVEYEIYPTGGQGDATSFVRDTIASKPEGDIYRFYACGGDGTLSEVAAGAIDEACAGPIPGVQIGCVPIGTGNDFVRNFKQSEFFADITKQLLADPVTIDCYAYRDLESDAPDRYGINMANIGFDCDVVVEASKLKRRKLFPKKLAYIGGILLTLRYNRGRTLTVIRSDGAELSGEFELVAVANGGFCGGGFYSAPKSQLNDGLLDLSFINKLTRREFIGLVGPYKKGTHLDLKNTEKFITYIQDKSVIFDFDEPTDMCFDGDILRMRKIGFRVVPSAIDFLLPVGVVYKTGA